MMLNHNNMPGAGSIADTMEFMRKMWSGMGAPSIGIPSLSVEEINKKIADLKTVASWLELNMNMLRATIQTLEVQSATLSTLQAMGAILTPHESGKAQADPGAASPFNFSAWPSQVFAQKTSDEEVTDEESTGQNEEHDAEAEPEAKDAADAEEKTERKPFSFPESDFQASMVNPNAWWNLLQDQFRQAVGNVLADQATPEKAAASAREKATKPQVKAKPRTRAKSTVVQSRHSKPASRKRKSP